MLIKCKNDSLIQVREDSLSKLTPCRPGFGCANIEK
jgi:hypothetical protein